MYRLTGDNYILRLSDNTFILIDDDSPAYQKYLEWVAKGGVPAPHTKGKGTLKLEVDSQRDAKLAAGVEWDGKLWYTDDVFQGQITARVAGWNAGIIPADAVKPVRAKTGEVFMLTYEQHKELSAALFEYVEGVYGWSWITKAQIDAAPDNDPQPIEPPEPVEETVPPEPSDPQPDAPTEPVNEPETPSE